MKKASGILLFLVFLVLLFPLNAKAESLPPPLLDAKTAISIDVSTGEIIYAKNIDTKIYPASMTKLLTALILSENYKLTDTLKYGSVAAEQPPYAMRSDLSGFKIKINDTMTVNDVMDALMLYSANDAAGMVADNMGGSEEAFAKIMNAKAADLHMTSSNFVTPNGLHDDNHYSTAYDMSLLVRAAYADENEKNVMSLPQATISSSEGTSVTIANRNALLGQDGCVGGKTGFTDEAGRCLSAIYVRDGRVIVGVVCNSTPDSEDKQVFTDMTNLINYSYSLPKTMVFTKGDTIETKTLSYKLFKYFGPLKTVDVPVIATDDLGYYENETNIAENKENTTINDLDVWNLSKDSPIGSVSFKERDYSKDVPLYVGISTQDIIDANKSTYILSGVLTVCGVFCLIFIVLVITAKGRHRRRKR